MALFGVVTVTKCHVEFLARVMQRIFCRTFKILPDVYSVTPHQNNGHVILKKKCREGSNGVGFMHELKSYDRRRCHVSSQWTPWWRVPGRPAPLPKWKTSLLQFQHSCPQTLLIHFKVFYHMQNERKKCSCFCLKQKKNTRIRIYVHK